VVTTYAILRDIEFWPVLACFCVSGHISATYWHEKGPSEWRGQSLKALQLKGCRRRDLNPRHTDYDFVEWIDKIIDGFKI
jgi:hypothetical protein